ncbi:MAG: DUF2116 family Zn-ribbon domain-containing protein [Candidatus Egerieousia sp.]
MENNDRRNGKAGIAENHDTYVGCGCAENDDEYRTCPVCGGRITGRIDKKFCSDDCRSYYNNRLRRQTVKSMGNSNEVRNIRKSVLWLAKSNATFLLKIVSAVSGVCKILTKFVSL